MILSCCSCNAKDVRIESKVRNHLKSMNQNYKSEIMGYIVFADIFLLHKLRDESHMICNKCFSEKKNIANRIFDTNMITCPICPREIIVG